MGKEGKAASHITTQHHTTETCLIFRMCGGGGGGGGGRRSPLRHQANNHFKRERVGTLYYYLTSFSEAFVFAWIASVPEKLLNASSMPPYTVHTGRKWQKECENRFCTANIERDAEGSNSIWSVSDAKGFFFPLDFPITSVTFCGVLGEKKSFLYIALMLFKNFRSRTIEQHMSV